MLVGIVFCHLQKPLVKTEVFYFKISPKFCNSYFAISAFMWYILVLCFCFQVIAKSDGLPNTNMIPAEYYLVIYKIKLLMSLCNVPVHMQPHHLYPLSTKYWTIFFKVVYFRTLAKLCWKTEKSNIATGTGQLDTLQSLQQCTTQYSWWCSISIDHLSSLQHHYKRGRWAN